MGAMALSDDQIGSHLADLDGWKQAGRSITKTYQCDDFNHALDFVMHVGELAEEQNHHPDLDIRYDKVTVTLSTHSDGGVTDQDLTLARQIEDLEL